MSDSDPYADLYEALAQRALWSASSLEDRERRCRDLLACGFTPAHIEALARSTRSADNPIAALAVVLRDPPTAMVRAMAHMAHEPKEEPEHSHINGCGDVLARSRRYEAESQGISEAEVLRRRWDAAIYEAVAAAHIGIVCWRSSVCLEDEKRPACCVKEWLRRHGIRDRPMQYVWDAIDRHCARNPDEPWTTARLKEYHSSATTKQRRHAIALQINAEVRAKADAEAEERAAAKAAAKKGQPIRNEAQWPAAVPPLNGDAKAAPTPPPPPQDPT